MICTLNDCTELCQLVLSTDPQCDNLSVEILYFPHSHSSVRTTLSVQSEGLRLWRIKGQTFPRFLGARHRGRARAPLMRDLVPLLVCLTQFPCCTLAPHARPHALPMAEPVALPERVSQEAVFRALHALPNKRALPEDVARAVLGTPEGEKPERGPYRKVWKALDRLARLGRATSVGGIYTALGSPDDVVDGRALRYRGALLCEYASLRSSCGL